MLASKIAWRSAGVICSSSAAVHTFSRLPQFAGTRLSRICGLTRGNERLCARNACVHNFVAVRQAHRACSEALFVLSTLVCDRRSDLHNAANSWSSRRAWSARQTVPNAPPCRLRARWMLPTRNSEWQRFRASTTESESRVPTVSGHPRAAQPCDLGVHAIESFHVPTNCGRPGSGGHFDNDTIALHEVPATPVRGVCGHRTGSRAQRGCPEVVPCRSLLATGLANAGHEL